MKHHILRRCMPAALFVGLVAGSSFLSTSEFALGQQPGQKQRSELAKLIEDLGAESFDVRRDAKQSLFDMGEAAIPALKKTAQDRSKDLGYSAVRILSRMLKEKTGKTSAAAQTALQELAKGDDAMARQAREALEEAATEQPRGLRGIGGFPPMQGGQNIQQFGAGRSTQTSIVNGSVRTVVREGTRTVEITREPDGPVSITLTDKGKKPKKWSADSLAELEKKHAEGFKIYQEYGANAARMPNFPNLQFPFGAGRIALDPFGPMDPFDGFDPFGQMRKRRVNPRVKQEFEDASMLMDDMAALIKSLKRKSDAPEVQQLERKLSALRRSVDRIKAETAK